MATADGTTQVIDITINGANDAAVITGTATDSVTEASGVSNGTPGDATASGDSRCDRRRQRGDLHGADAVAKTYGTFSIDATGAWSYTLDDGNADVQALNVGRARCTSWSRSRRPTARSRSIDITINGANDAAVITGTATDAVTETSGVATAPPAHATASGDLYATDVDSSAAFMVQSGGAKTYGTFSIDAAGAWSYTLDDDNADVQALNTGGTLHELVTVATADGTPADRHHHQRRQRRGGDHRHGDRRGDREGGIANATAGNATATGTFGDRRRQRGDLVAQTERPRATARSRSTPRVRGPTRSTTPTPRFRRWAQATRCTTW